MFISLQADILRKLIVAEDKGSPLTPMQLGSEVRSSSFQDLWDQKYINIKGQEDQLFCTAHQDAMFVASSAGREWLAEYDKRKRA